MRCAMPKCHATGDARIESSHLPNVPVHACGDHIGFLAEIVSEMTGASLLYLTLTQRPVHA